MESNKYIPETFFFCYCFFSAVVVICRHNFYLLFSLKISDLHLWGKKKYGKTISSHFRSLGLWERGKYRFSSTGLASKSTSSVIFIFFFLILWSPLFACCSLGFLAWNPHKIHHCNMEGSSPYPFSHGERAQWDVQGTGSMFLIPEASLS